MIKIHRDRTFYELLVRAIGKTVKIRTADGSRLTVDIISVGRDCIQVDKLGSNIIPISAITMLTLPRGIPINN